MLEINNMSLKINNKDDLDNINLQLLRGESCSIRCKQENQGHALLLSLLGAQAIVKGNILFNNQSISDNSVDKLSLSCKNIGFASDYSPFFDLFSIVENIALTASYHNAISQQELNDRIMNIVQLLKIEDLLDVPFYQLPLTRQKLFILARELVRQPDLLLLDYLLDQLIPEDKQLADQAILSICNNQGMSVISITHQQTLLVALKNYELRNNCLQVLLG